MKPLTFFVALIAAASMALLAFSPVTAETVRSGINHQTFSGSRLAYTLQDTPLTDAQPAATLVVKGAANYRDIVVDVSMDKGATVVITPLLDDYGYFAGEPSTAGVVADGGEAKRFEYINISAPLAKVVVTKTEAGDATTTKISVRGRN